MNVVGPCLKQPCGDPTTKWFSFRSLPFLKADRQKSYTDTPNKINYDTIQSLVCEYYMDSTFSCEAGKKRNWFVYFSVHESLVVIFHSFFEQGVANFLETLLIAVKCGEFSELHDVVVLYLKCYRQLTP